MITKEQFVNLMQKWQALEEQADEIDDVLHRTCGASLGELWWGWSGLVSDVIRVAMDDKYDWVAYFAYERDFDLSKDCVYDSDNNALPTHSWEAIYDIIAKENQDG